MGTTMARIPLQRRCGAGVLIGLALLMSSLQAIATCPPVPSDAELKRHTEEDSEALLSYAYLRLFACGWEKGGGAFPAALADIEGSPAEALISLIAVDRDNWVSLKREELQDIDPLLSTLYLPPTEHEAALRRYDEALPKLVDFVQSTLALTPEQQFLFDLALVGEDVRQDRFDAASRRLDRLDKDLPASGTEETLEDSRDLLRTLRAALDGRTTTDVIETDWVLGPSHHSHACGLGREVIGGPFDSVAIAAKVVADRRDLDAAIGILLRADWRDEMEGRQRYASTLATLLRQRYGESELQQAWSDAEASLHVDRAAPGLTLFGQRLPLPRAIREEQAESRDERPLTREEVLQRLRATVLHQTLWPDAATDAQSRPDRPFSRP